MRRTVCRLQYAVRRGLLDAAFPMTDGSKKRDNQFTGKTLKMPAELK